MGTGVSRLAMTGKSTINPYFRGINVSVQCANLYRVDNSEAGHAKIYSDLFNFFNCDLGLFQVVSRATHTQLWARAA